MKYKDMATKEIKKITYENCPLKCVPCESLCEATLVAQCRENLSDAFDGKDDQE